MKYLAVIPARAGSKSIKNKNSKLLHGKPLFIWTVEQALKSKCDKIVVSTNDNYVMQIIDDYKTNLAPYGFYDIEKRLSYVQRPEEISTDTSPSEAALIHAAEAQEDKPEFVVMLQPTSPFRFNGMIDRCLDKIEEKKADSLLTTLKLYDFFWFEGCDPLLESKGIDSWVWRSSYRPNARKMRQAMGRDELKYFDNGNLYITRFDELKKSNCRLAGKVCAYEISYIESMQIDYPEEFDVCEKIMRGELNKMM